MVNALVWLTHHVTDQAVKTSLFVRILPSDAGHKSTSSECIHPLHGLAVSNLGILTFCQLYATLRETILYYEKTKHKNKNNELSGKKDRSMDH